MTSVAFQKTKPLAAEKKIIMDEVGSEFIQTNSIAD